MYASIGEYMKFIRMWLKNDGAGPHASVLNKDTVEAAVRNGLQSHQKVVMLPGVPTLSNDAEFFPGLRKSWSYTFMVNDETAPIGRPAGGVGWAR